MTSDTTDTDRDEPTLEERTADLVEYWIRLIGKSDLLRALAEGDQFFDSVPEAHQEEATRLHTQAPDVHPADICRLVVEADHYDALRTATHQSISESITHHVEQGYSRPDAAVTVVESQVRPSLPGWFRSDVIRAEIDLLEGTMPYREWYGELIHLYQVLSEYESPEATREDRRELWAEALKYAKYAVTIEFTREDGSSDSKRFTTWEQQSSTAHNQLLRRFRERGPSHDGIERVTTHVLKLHYPDTDPLADLEEFVYRGL